MPPSCAPATTHRFAEDGFCFTPPLLEPELIAAAVTRMDAVIAGEYATGVAPYGRFEPHGAAGLRKIDQVHVCDPVLRQVCTHPAIGAWAARLLGAQRIQLWAVQLLLKPPESGAAGAIGFHQDRWYWRYWTEDSEVFTAWIALSDVTAASGPMRFVRGSHRWGTLVEGDYFNPALQSPRELHGVAAEVALEEVPAILPPGAVSYHHRLTLHGSGPNRTRQPRRALALHLRTERSAPVPGASDYYISHLEDPDLCPVLHDASPVPA